MPDQIIHNFSNQNLLSFFQKKITSFKPEKDVFDNVVAEESPFANPEKIGHAELNGHDELLVFTCFYEGELTSRSAKKKQFEIAKKVLKEDFKDGAIFIFYDAQGNFRFSLVRRYYGKDKKYSNWRRFTYYVRPDKNNKTFKRSLDKCDFSSLDGIQEAFSVEALSKEFYQKLSHWYFASLNEVRFPNDIEENQHQTNSQAMIRMITRVMFVWFMKQKKLIPEEIFDKAYLDKVLNYEDRTGSTYYKAILQNLFFATLNTEMSDKRKWITTSGYGVQHFYRYKRYFIEKETDAFITMMKKIPFLNGGLFENLDIIETANKEKDIPKKDIRIDCFSDNPKNEERLVVPDFLFFGTRNADISTFLDDKRKDNVEIEGLIDLLNRYDFTIDENSLDDQEVALDPELLGTVFENLLASYNPETQSTARKESGSFYTPRPIVDYMVKESLFYYLKDKSGVKEEKLRLLIDGNEAEKITEEEKHLLVDQLTHIKILDPACGSGAFPMGALQQMVRLLNLIDPGNRIYKEKLQKKLKTELQQTIDESNYEELKSNIEEVFSNQLNDPDYARKLFLIQNCLYGVDIQSIAMQITKLRFFISLLVEQQIDEKGENLGVKPLPNLETKFVAANTLIGLNRQDGELKNPGIQDLEEELAKVREKYFGARTYETKRKYRAKDLEIREEIAALLVGDGWANKTANQIARWDPFDQNASSTWFDPEWMFGVKNFDVVIGNPPYIDSERMVNLGMSDLRDELKNQYKSLKGNWDIYIAFFDLGFSLLSKSGVLSHITPDKWLNKTFGKELRRNHYKKLSKIARTGRDVFQSVGVDSIVTIFQNQNSTTFTLVNYDGNFKETEIIDKSLLDDPFQLDIIFSDHLNFILKISKKFTKNLNSYNLLCENACSTSETYELKKYLRDDHFDKSKFKVVNTGTIDKYKSKWGNKEMTYLRDKYLKPIVDRNVFEHKMSNTYFKKTQKAKLIIKGMTLLDVMCDEYGDYIPGKSTLIISNLDKYDKYTLLLFQCLLNTKLPLFYLRERFSASSYNGGITFNKDMFNKLPLPSSLDGLNKISKTIYEKTENGEDTTAEEREIDQLVYKLYELTYKEVKIVDPGFPVSEEDYEKVEIE